MTDKAIQPIQGNIVMPAVNAKEALEAWKQYQELKEAIVDKKTDVQKIGGNDYLKKSYWRKVATFFNLSVEVVEERSEKIGKTFVWHFTCKAIAPNGRFAIGTGSCDAFEKATIRDGQYMTYNRYRKEWEPAQPNSLHNIRSTAETRAFNRAVSNLVGGGEVSSEEIVVRDEQEYSEPIVTQSPKQSVERPAKTQTEEELMKQATDEAEASRTKPITNPATCEVCGQPATEKKGITKAGKQYHGIFCSTEDRSHTKWLWDA